MTPSSVLLSTRVCSTLDLFVGQQREPGLAQMALHEYYFGNLAPGADLSPGGALAGGLVEAWGDIRAWREDFAKTAEMRGIGWAIHEVNHPAGLRPILVLDVFEHAWMVDYGAGEKARYVEAFLENVNWEIVERRFTDGEEEAHGPV